MEVLEGQNILVTISGKKNKIRVYYLSWLKTKIFKSDQVSKYHNYNDTIVCMRWVCDGFSVLWHIKPVESKSTNANHVSWERQSSAKLFNYGMHIIADIPLFWVVQNQIS